MQARSHVVFQRPHLSGFGLDMASTAVTRQPSHCRNPPDETGARVFWLLSYSVLYVIPLPQTHKHTKALARGGEEGEGAGRGLEFYQNSICRDASKTGLTLSMSVARGQAWGRGENTSWPGKGGPLRAGLDQGCVCGWRGGKTLPSPSLGPLRHLTFFLDIFFFFFGQTVTFQTSDSKCSVSQNIMKLGLLPFTWGSPVSGGAEGSPGAGALILGEIYSVEAILHCPLSLLQPCSKSIQIGK